MPRLLLVLLLAGTGACAQSQALAALRSQFLTPPDNARIMMRWWWFGPAVVNSELARELRVMKDAGIGGVEVQPVYPVALDDENIHNYPYLSPQFLNSLQFTGATAKSLGLRMDLTLGSGWPFGGPHIPANLASSKLRIEKAKAVTGLDVTPPLADGESLISVVAGDTEITYYIASRTGQQVKRPAVGAEGFVLDHYDRAAIELHLKTAGDKMLAALGPNTPYAVFCDSLEVYGADWTTDFLAEFRKRRGYDLLPHLPQLASGAGDEAVAVRSDWGHTLTDLVNDHFFAPMQQWAARHGTKLRAQAYGTPPAAISTNALIDLPEGEGIQWKTLSQLRYATSSAHVLGRLVVSSETWTWLHSPVFRATPLDMKAEANLHFLQGVNQLVGHGWPYTAPGEAYPGWRFYASGVWDEKNPWFIAMPEMAKYFQRVSNMLRQGKPANDVALYMPNSDAWGHFSPGKVDLRAGLAEHLGPDIIATILETGYGLDAFDDGVLASAKIEGQKLAMGSVAYSAVVLPAVETIPLETLRKLDQFVQAGGVLIATRRLPDKAPGFKATAADHDEVRKIVARLFQGDAPKAYLVKDDKGELAARLANTVTPDAAFPADAHDFGFVHRTLGSSEVYFVANTGNQKRTLPVKFRQQGTAAEIWDPLSTRSTPAAVANGTVTLTLEPYGSRFVVFSKDAGTQPAVEAAAPADIDLSQNWEVTFEKAKPAEMATLQSWTANEVTRYYSGTATYEKEIDVSDAWLKKGLQANLNFGEGTAIPRTPGMGYQAQFEGPVREAAVVYVNGKRAGAVWCPPYTLDIGGLLHAGKNSLRVVVGNLAVNYMAGRRLPDYKLLNLRYTERFTPQDMDKIQPVTAGLLGPIRLRATNTNP
jgi:hypothetical protein